MKTLLISSCNECSFIIKSMSRSPYCKHPKGPNRVGLLSVSKNCPLVDEKKLVPIRFPKVGTMPDNIDCPVCGTLCHRGKK